MKSLPKNYEHKEAENRWQKTWEEKGVYHWRDDLPREQTFVIDTPPPTVSGVLHMGHIFSYTQADFVARYQRMSGKDVFYPMGFDDNGLPTERLVEKVKNVRATALSLEPNGREKFVALCREVVQDAEEQFRALFRSAALSVDWRQEYQTVSDDVTALSQASFLDLYNKGEVYRDFRPTYWDWVDQTAIAQAEIENKDMAGAMYDLRFALEDGAPITIATTRPELLGACVAVMYHPEDTNAAKYKGKHAITPLFGVKVPMIADEAVDKEFGTGLVMCCTFGDDTDKDWWRKYKLPLRALLTKEGRLDFTNPLFTESFAANDLDSCIRKNDAIQPLQGLKPKQAHAKVVELLQAEGALLSQKNINHTVKCAERSGTPIEIIPTHQWFVRITDKKDALLTKGAECNWNPDYMRIRLNQWIEGLKEDWCISRQRFFGVPFPVWYSKRTGEEGRIIVATADQLPIDPLTTPPKGYGMDEVTPESGVMDTWATSSISPQINARAIHGDSHRFNKLFPADVRPQAHEIIRTWAFYTIVKAHLHTNTVPWKNLMISGWCLAADKTKMSKSKGNVVTPVELIQDKGSDAVRYWASTSRLGTDTAFSEEVLKIGRKLVTKLWNASNFASMQLGKIKQQPATAADDVKKGIIGESLDLWILTRLNETVARATAEFERMEYCDARVAVEDFFWNDFCDNYLELVKERAYNEKGENDTGQQSALHTLHHCLNALLRLFAPFVPHVTEEIFSYIFDDQFALNGSLHARGNWPKAEDYPSSAAHKDAGIACLGLLEAIRKAKSERNMSLKTPLGHVKVKANKEESAAMLDHLAQMLPDLKGAANADSVSFGEVIGGEKTITTDERFTLSLPFIFSEAKETGAEKNEIRQRKGEPKLENPIQNLHYQGHCTTAYKNLSHSAKVEVDPIMEQAKGKSR